MSNQSKHVYNEVVKRLQTQTESNIYADRNPGQLDKWPIPKHKLYNEDAPCCAYCSNTSGLRVGLLPISGTVAFCKKHERNFYDDKEWESE